MPERSIYLAGPMTGYPEHNVPAFLAMAARLRERGFLVVVPCEGHEDPALQEARTWEEWMERDILLVLEARGGVAVLPDGEASRGASLEVTVASSLGRPIYDATALADAVEAGCTDPWTLDLTAAYVVPPARPCGLGRRSLDEALAEAVEWALATFPHASPRSTALHLLKEAHELVEDPRTRTRWPTSPSCSPGARDSPGSTLPPRCARSWRSIARGSGGSPMPTASSTT